MAVGFDMRDKPQQATCDTNVRHLRADPKMHLKGIHGIYICMGALMVTFSKRKNNATTAGFCSMVTTMSLRSLFRTFSVTKRLFHNSIMIQY